MHDDPVPLVTRLAGRRRAKGEGGVYRRADVQWTGTVELGRVGGKRCRKVLYARTRPELLRKMRAAQDRRDPIAPRQS